MIEGPEEKRNRVGREAIRITRDAYRSEYPAGPVPTGYLPGATRNNPRVEQIQKAQRQSKSTETSSSDSSEVEDDWILTIIDRQGRTAEMGGLMYELPAGLVLDSVRKAELYLSKIWENFRAKGINKKELQTTEASAVNPYPNLLIDFALHHRVGHLQGLRKIQEETGTKLIQAILKKAEEKGNSLKTKNLIYQAAALLESAGDNKDLRAQLETELSGRSLWKNRVIEKNAASGMEIPGLTTQETENLFKGAKSVTIPEPIKTKGDPFFNQWQMLTVKTTYDRAKMLIEPKRYSPLKRFTPFVKASSIKIYIYLKIGPKLSLHLRLIKKLNTTL